MLFTIIFVGNTLAPTGQQYDNKTGQWFGSLVRSSGEDGVVLVSFVNSYKIYKQVSCILESTELYKVVERKNDIIENSLNYF